MVKTTEIKATKIKMHDDESSDDITGIKSIYLEGNVKSEQFYTKEKIHEFLSKSKENIIIVDYPPYPELVPRETQDGHKYVKSEKDKSKRDNLLNLPKE